MKKKLTILSVVEMTNLKGGNKNESGKDDKKEDKDKDTAVTDALPELTVAQK